MGLRHCRLKLTILRILLACCLGIGFFGLYVTWKEYEIWIIHDRLSSSLVRSSRWTDLCQKETIENNGILFPDCDVNLHRILQSSYSLTVNISCPYSTVTHTLESSGNSGDDVIKISDRPFGQKNLCNGQYTPMSTTLNYSFPFGSSCLKEFIAGHCFDKGLLVPRVVHYVWFTNLSIDVYMFVSVLSAYRPVLICGIFGAMTLGYRILATGFCEGHSNMAVSGTPWSLWSCGQHADTPQASRFLKPCLILVHADLLPTGHYWHALRVLVPLLVHVKRQAPTAVFGKPLGFVQHQADIARLEALREYGGIYLDADQIVLKSLDEFRKLEFVMGHESPENLANSLLISAPKARFIDIWYRHYRTYNAREWGIHSTFLPFALSRRYPSIVANAGYAFVKPDLPAIGDVWVGHYNWTGNYAIHLYVRSVRHWHLFTTDHTLDSLVQLKSSLGEISRHVLFADKNSCKRLQYFHSTKLLKN